MKADTLDLKDIFRKDARYVVPRFQRPYVWKEEEHWQPLWEDLRQVVDELLDHQAGATDQFEREEAQAEASPHFLGAVVLEQVPAPTRKLESREIIDGQQRLITLQVLLSAAHDVAEAHDDERSASMFEKLMFNDEDLINTDTDRLKVWPIETDQEAFTNVMSLSDSQSEISTLEREDTLQDCFHYFRDQIDEWVSQGELFPSRVS